MPVVLKEYLYSQMVLVCSCGYPDKARNPFGKKLPRAPKGLLFSPRPAARQSLSHLGCQLIRRSGNNLTVQCILLSRYPLLQCPAHGGSLLQTCVPNTLPCQVKYSHDIRIHYISEKCLAYSCIFRGLISIC